MNNSFSTHSYHRSCRSLLWIFILCMVWSGSIFAQAPQFIFAERYGGEAQDIGWDIRFDNDGNRVMNGSFSSNRLRIADTILVDADGLGDSFMAKFDALGNPRWVRHVRGAGSEFLGLIDINAQGDIVAGGQFGDTLHFGDTLFVSLGIRDMFLSKFSSDGDLLWVKRYGGAGIDIIIASTFDDFGNIIFIARFSDTVTFNDTTLSAVGNDIVIAKHDPDGNLLWVRQITGSGDQFPERVAADANGDIIITGIMLGVTGFGDTTLTDFGNGDLFLARYDANGSLLWVRQAGGDERDSGIAIAVDGDGSILVTGYFSSDASFGDTIITAVDSTDIIVAKYDPNGNLRWVRQAGGPGPDVGLGLLTDSRNNVILTGQFRSPLLTVGDSTLASAGDYDILVAKYEHSGNFIWAKQAGGPGWDHPGFGLALDFEENVWLTGAFQQTAFFDNLMFTSAGDRDIFIAKLSDVPTSVEPQFFSPQTLRLFQNYPNPFNPSTAISYRLSASNDVRLAIYNLSGQKIRTLVREKQSAGAYQVLWDGRDDAGQRVSSGIYFYKLTAGQQQAVNKMMLIE